MSETTIEQALDLARQAGELGVTVEYLKSGAIRTGIPDQFKTATTLTTMAAMLEQFVADYISDTARIDRLLGLLDKREAELKVALAKIEELEKAALANMAQESQSLGLYDYYPESEE